MREAHISLFRQIRYGTLRSPALAQISEVKQTRYKIEHVHAASIRSTHSQLSFKLIQLALYVYGYSPPLPDKQRRLYFQPVGAPDVHTPSRHEARIAGKSIVDLVEHAAHGILTHDYDFWYECLWGEHCGQTIDPNHYHKVDLLNCKGEDLTAPLMCRWACMVPGRTEGRISGVVAPYMPGFECGDSFQHVGEYWGQHLVLLKHYLLHGEFSYPRGYYHHLSQPTGFSLEQATDMPGAESSFASSVLENLKVGKVVSSKNQGPSGPGSQHARLLVHMSSALKYAKKREDGYLCLWGKPCNQILYGG